MAAPLSRSSSLFSALRSSSSPPSQEVRVPLSHSPRRSYHVELGAREKALLEVDPALKKFKSYKNSVKVASKIRNALTALAIAGCSYQIAVRALTK